VKRNSSEFQKAFSENLMTYACFANVLRRNPGPSKAGLQRSLAKTHRNAILARR